MECLFHYTIISSDLEEAYAYFVDSIGISYLSFVVFPHMLSHLDMDDIYVFHPELF